MPDINTLMPILQEHLRWNRVRLFTLCALVRAAQGASLQQVPSHGVRA